MNDSTPPPAAARTASWKWAVCVVLLLATMLNYMDRLTVTQMAVRIQNEFKLDNKQYSLLDSAFSVAFAFGALAWGWMVDRWNSWWIYPLGVLLWSLAGAATGLVPKSEAGGSEALLEQGLLSGYVGLLFCRFLLGFTESAHWPCALKTTQQILPQEQRTLGNGILQSGAAVGSVVAPLAILGILKWSGNWRHPFLFIGCLGILWVVAWLLLVRPRDLAHGTVPAGERPANGDSSLSAFFRTLFAERRFWVLVFLVICINGSWHFFRVWMPKFLEQRHGYEEDEVQFFTSAYYLVAGLGSAAAGVATLFLARRGMSVHGSRLFVFTVCTALSTLSLVVIILPSGPLLLALMLIIAFGSLGLFPPYYSLTQELSSRDQGKVTGCLGCICWLVMALMRYIEGFLVDETNSYGYGLASAGIMPVLGLIVLLLYWPKERGLGVS